MPDRGARWWHGGDGERRSPVQLPVARRCLARRCLAQGIVVGHSDQVTRLIGPAVVVLIASSANLGCGLRWTSDATVSIAASASATGLECVGEREQLLEYDLVAEERGAATEESAAAAVLSFYIDRHGGQRVMLRSNAYGMELDGRTVVVADVTPAPVGGFWVTTVHVCDSFVPVETGPPETVTPVSSGPSLPVLMRGDGNSEVGRFPSSPA